VGNFTLSVEALDDLHLIWAYIAKDNPEAADRVVEAARRMCNILAEHPDLGQRRQFPAMELAGIRSFVVTDFPNYILFYRVAPGGVEIVRVLHGARDIERLFGGS